MMSDETQGDAAGMVEATGAEPLIDPETGWSRLMVERMVKSIHIASAISSWVWTTTIYQGRPILNIGNINFVSGGKNGAMYLLVDREALKPGAVEMFEAFRTAGDLHSNPSFSWVDLPLDSTADALAVFADAHEAAIRKEAKKWKINQRWKWFQDEARQTISKVAGEDIPEPGYMQQLRELKSTDPLPPISGMYSQAMIEQMAASILAAHELGASCWSLFEAAKRIVLNVGQETVGGSNKAGTYDFVVDRELLTPEQDEWASVHLKPKPTDQYPSLLFLQLPDDTESDRLSDLQEAHISALTKLTKVFKKATLWKLHQEDFRIQIEQVSGLAIPQPGYLPPPSTRYWKMSPGANAVHWNQFQDKSVIAVHWLDDPKDLRQLPKVKAEFVAAIDGYSGATSQTANALWDFAHEVKVGDRVLAYGNKTVLGYGTVTGEYESVQDDFLFHHRRNMEWDNLESTSTTVLSDPLQRKLGRNATIVELFEAEFEQAIGKQPVTPLDVKSGIRLHFQAQGLHYTDAQTATFYTALQTKGFVVLSGISGTGKSKIAQHFVELLPIPQEEPVDPPASGVLRLKRMPSFPAWNRVTLPARQIEALSFPDRNELWPVRARMDGRESECTLHVQWNGGQRTVQIHIKGELRTAISRVEENGRFYGLVGLDDETGRISRIDFFRDLARQLPVAGQSPPRAGSNHLFLSVRPDWRDSTSLLGYFNPLTGQYQWTDFLTFILRAVESYKAKDGLAWFVILDEMNLAHVEYYFADLLSVIESGRGKNGFSKEPLRTSYPESGEEDDVPPREIFLPPSLYIIGTVNMDETTHAFSPKVLDRAFTIELTEVDFEHYLPATVGAGSAIDDAQKQAMLAAFTRDGKFAQIDKEEVAAAVSAHPEIREQLQSLNVLLKRNRFHFGYRIFDEIAQYIHNNDINGMMPFEEAFDQAVFMKVLPKFTGAKSRLRTPLLALLAWSIDPVAPDPVDVTERFDAYLSAPDNAPKVLSEGPQYPTVALRALQMLETLETDGFVSFG